MATWIHRLVPLILVAATDASIHAQGMSCGNGALELVLGEQCDDGNGVGADGCDPACQYEPVGSSCGDGAIDTLEVCDDGNVSNGDTCNPTCNFANATTLFAGAPGTPGLVDGVGSAARFGTGANTMVTDGTYIWMADTSNNAIRRITVATGEVLTVAGNATAGYVDDSNGANARFSLPIGIATDGMTVWISDGGNRVLRAMSASPPYGVTTVAGSSAPPSCSPTPCYVDGIGAAASFDVPRGLVYAGGYVYLLEANAATLRRFDPVSREVITVAGTYYQPGTTDGIGLSARFVSPRHVAAGDAGTLYIADTNGAKVRAFNTATREVQTLAGDGTVGYVDGVGTSVRVNRPRGLTFDGTSVYWVEVGQHTVRQIVLPTGQVTTLAGSHCGGAPCSGGYAEGVGVSARFNQPTDMIFHFPSRSLFVFDAGNALLRRIQ